MNSWNVAFDGVKSCLKAGPREFVVCAGARNAAVAFRGTGAPQSIEQPGIFGNHAWQRTIADSDGKQSLHLNAESEEAFEPDDDNFSREKPGDFTRRRTGSTSARWPAACVKSITRGSWFLLAGWNRTSATTCFISVAILACRSSRKW